MIERTVHFLFFEHRGWTLATSVAFYLSVLFLINLSGITQAARRARARVS